MHRVHDYIRTITAIALLPFLLSPQIANANASAEALRPYFQFDLSAPCKARLDDLIPQTPCEALALRDNHRGQLAALATANGVLSRASNLPDRADRQQVIEAIGVVRDSAARLVKDHPPASADMLPEMQADFARRGWAAPSDLVAGWSFLRDRLQGQYVPDRNAIYQAASQLSGRLHNRYANAVSKIVSAKELEIRIAYGEARKQAMKQERIEKVESHGEYMTNVSERASKMPSALNFWWVLGLIMAVISVWHNRRKEWRLIIVQAVAWAIAPVAAEMPVYAVYLVTGIPGWVGLLMWLVLFGVIFRGLHLFGFGVTGFGAGRRATHGSARWSTVADMLQAGRLALLGQQAKGSAAFALGRVLNAPKDHDNRLRYTGHLITCAPNRSGKGIGAVIPTLLEYPGSVIVLDVKGENYAVTARRRREMGHEVYLVDPFGVIPKTRDNRPRYVNWLDELDVKSDDVVSEAQKLADTLIMTDNEQNAFFTESAKDLLRGMLIYVASYDDETKRNMAEVRRIITGSSEELDSVLRAMAASSIGHDVPKRSANSFLGMDQKVKSNVLSDLRRQTSWLDDPRMITAVSRNDFSFSDLKRKPMSIYVVIPANKLEGSIRYIRAMYTLALSALTRTLKGKPEHDVLFLFDEFAQLGRMEAVENAVSLVRGYGISFWFIIQDVSQLKSVYTKWQTFFANSAKQFFTTSDFETAKYISDTLGQHTIAYTTTNSSQSSQDGSWKGSSSDGVSEQVMSRALLTPDEVMNLPNKAIVIINGERPHILDRINYLADKEYRGQFDPNPAYP